MARDTAPPISTTRGDGGEPDDDLIVTRESLDGSATALSQWEGRAWLLRRDQPAEQPDEPPGEPPSGGVSEPSPLPAPGKIMRIVWSNSLTLRQKALRAGGIALLVILTTYLLIGGPAATPGVITRAGDALNARLRPPKPQPTLAERGYVFVKSPPGSYNLPQISIAPVVDRANAAWACWSSPFAPGAQRGVPTAQAFYTESGGARWTRLQLPRSGAQHCTVIADGENSASALVFLDQGQAPDGSCIAPFVYFSADSGQSWTQVPWPLGPSESACQYDAALEGGAIYLWSRAPLLREASLVAPPTSRLIVSRDHGQTWAAADEGLNDAVGYDIVGFRPGGHILARVADVHGNGADSLLMSSDDYGASWRALGRIPGGFSQVFASSDRNVTDHGGWGRLYVLARVIVNDSLTLPPAYALWTGYAGGQWSSIPLPPLPTGAAATADANQPLVIGVGPAGSLETERGVLEIRDAQLNAARLLWVWDPAHAQWLLDPEDVPGNLALEGASWRAGDQITWVTTLQLGVPPVLKIYTKTYPADLLAHIQRGQPTPSRR